MITKNTVPAQIRRDAAGVLATTAEEEGRTQTDVLSAALLVALRDRAALRAQLASMPGRSPAGEGRRFKKRSAAP